MSKDILYSAEARRKVLKGVERVADAVRVTLGPKGRNVAYARENLDPSITKDGVTVASQIDTDDPQEKIGLDIIKAVAGKASEVAGDGTTTSTILASQVFKEGLRSVEAGANPIELKKGINVALNYAIDLLKKKSKPLSTNKEVNQVATISANGDKRVGDIIAKAIKEVGKDGAITVEEGSKFGVELEVVKGMQFDQGLLNHYFITNPQKGIAELNNTLVLLVDEPINSPQEIVGVLEYAANNKKPITVIAPEFKPEVLGTMITNKISGALQCVAVRSPKVFGSEFMEDIAAVTGAQVISQDTGNSLDDLTPEHLGRAEKVTVSNQNTILQINSGDQAIEDRIQLIKNELEKIQKDEFRKNILKTRIGKLKGGVAKIQVSSPSEVETEELLDRIDDALCATRAAVEEGIVAGGGSTMLFIHQAMSGSKTTSDLDIGYKLFVDALRHPIESIAENAGKNGGYISSKVIEIMQANKELYNFVDPALPGYDARKDEFVVSMLQEGIIDPTKVVRSALEQAASAAGTLLTTEAIITNKPQINE